MYAAPRQRKFLISNFLITLASIYNDSKAPKLTRTIKSRFSESLKGITINESKSRQINLILDAIPYVVRATTSPRINGPQRFLPLTNARHHLGPIDHQFLTGSSNGISIASSLSTKVYVLISIFSNPLIS